MHEWVKHEAEGGEASAEFVENVRPGARIEVATDEVAEGAAEAEVDGWGEALRRGLRGRRRGVRDVARVGEQVQAEREARERVEDEHLPGGAHQAVAEWAQGDRAEHDELRGDMADPRD